MPCNGRFSDWRMRRLTMVKDSTQSPSFMLRKVRVRRGKSFFSRAEKILQQHNISNKKISRKTTCGLSISSAIESEAQKGKYAVVAIGMRESKNNLAGKTTAELITKIEKASLWCCP